MWPIMSRISRQQAYRLHYLQHGFSSQHSSHRYKTTPHSSLHSQFQISESSIFNSKSQRMGNITSCFNAKSNTAKLIDLHRNTLRVVEAPVTAAELMLEEPGYVVAPLADFRRGSRISAMKADESLSGGGVYLLISISRINGKVSESEMAVIKSKCCERRAKRRSSKVIPIVTKTSGDGADNPVKVFGEGSDIGRPNYRIRQWKPALEPIREGI